MTNQFERKVFYSDGDKSWIALAPELPGCSAFGKSPKKALEELETAIELWLATAKAKKWRAPKPVAARDAGGKILLRLPRELHQEYLGLATEDGVFPESVHALCLGSLPRVGSLSASYEVKLPTYGWI